MKNSSKRLLGILLFGVIFSVLFYFSSLILFPKREGRFYGSASRIKSFYKVEKNSIDVLFIGASSFRNGVSPLSLWYDGGFTSFVRASGNQPPIVSYYYLRESLKRIKPKVVVIDGLMLFRDYDYNKNEPALRDAIDPMQLSLDKIALMIDVNKLVSDRPIFSYIFPFFRYHSRWSGITPNDLKNIFILKSSEIYRGQYIDYDVSRVNYPDSFMKPAASDDEIYLSSKVYYEKMVELCKANNINLVILSLPRFQSYNYTIHQKLGDFSEENNILFLDYSFPDSIKKMNIALETDFADPNHLNIWGSMKISKYIAEDLVWAFDLKDKRSDSSYEVWNKDHLTLISEIEKQELINSLK